MIRLRLRRPRLGAAGLLLVLCAMSDVALANHGPGASGGGAATISGETLKPGHFEIELREDFSQFQQFDRQGTIHRAMEGGDFDALDHGFFTTLSGAYGITEDFQVGAGVGYFIGNDFVSASDDNGAINFGRTNPHELGSPLVGAIAVHEVLAAVSTTTDFRREISVGSRSNFRTWVWPFFVARGIGGAAPAFDGREAAWIATHSSVR